MAEGFLKNITDNMIDKIIKRDFETKKDAVEKAFKDNLKKKYPKYKYSIIIDADISD